MSFKRSLQRLARPLTAKITREPLDRFLRLHATERLTLDVGASIGSYAMLFPNRIGIDIERAPGVHVVMDAHSLAFRDRSFDVVLATEILEHLPEPQRAVDEMRRVLRPGGSVVLTTRFLFPLHDAPGDYYRYTRYGLAHLFRQFDQVEIVEETDAMGTLAVLVQRLAIQADTVGSRAVSQVWHLVARVVRRLSFLITREYGDGRERRTVQPMMTSGYYLVARRAADGGMTQGPVERPEDNLR
jgi:SAM-dependent methyltransferase